MDRRDLTASRTGRTISGPGSSYKSPVDDASLALLLAFVRLTARASALIFAASLVAGAVELVAPHSEFARRGAGWKLLAALLVSHTIHFSLVLALAVATDGENVAGRGGWVLATSVGFAFYAAAGGALLLRRTAASARGVPQIAGETALCLVVGLAFLMTYLGGVARTPLYALMAALLAGAMLALVSAALVRIKLLAIPSS
jgi:hypothetical protein